MEKFQNHGKRLLLISNSTLYGGGYLDHAEANIRKFLGGVQRVLFVPFALYDRAAHADKARARFAAMGYRLESMHETSDGRQAVREAAAIFVGGGNTFRLLKALYDFELLAAIRQRVERGVPYIGSSAGSIVACPTIKTTKDMPIVQPPSFDALGLVPFQISPHYLDPDPNSTHMGETQQERIFQFLEENDAPVVGLREGAMLWIEDGRVMLEGCAAARVFHPCQAPMEAAPGSRLDDLLRPRKRGE